MQKIKKAYKKIYILDIKNSMLIYAKISKFIYFLKKIVYN
ncbi:hypothetical protein C672_0225 [[Clostridium] bifermentans ATCC 638]|uniref:Uncharacterized protein n=1 Tax=Paraclostridium bifermentans ATCC 638 = DSM 14991 TaxID=1233171 RepID=T4VVN1_PARBF|nr:hypothetical protein C672_0225 [[Clostridium] bifermentans ATCC 638] [Paraclostridium bifermentans ATCC 638 = DSM 14991]